jgi:hypothetical protein
MRIAALRRPRAEETFESPRTIALARGGTVAPFLLRPPHDDRQPARRLRAPANVPTSSRIVLRPLTLR